MAAKLKAPVDVQIEITQSCNWRCRHCYNFWRPEGLVTSPARHLSCQQLGHIVAELKANEVPSITITGGEPFSRPESVFTLLELAGEANIRASINTNLSLLGTHDIDRLAGQFGNVPILFSVLSSDALEHERLAGAPPGTHARVLETARRCIDRGLPLSMNMVLVRENTHAIESTARMAKDLGVRAFCATKALPNTHAPASAFMLTAGEVRDSLSELMRIEQSLGISVDILGCYPRCLFADTPAFHRFSHRTCVAGYTTVTIGADGGVRPCSHMETSYGNIFQVPLQRIWAEMEGWRGNEYIPDKCRDCRLVAGCRGGCRVNTLTPGLVNMDVYAVPERIRGVPDSPVPAQSAPAVEATLTMNPSARFRDESFGSIIYTTDPLNMMLVNRSTTTFLRAAALSGEKFEISGFLDRSGATTENERRSVEALYQKLFRKGFLITPQQKA